MMEWWIEASPKVFNTMSKDIGSSEKREDGEQGLAVSVCGMDEGESDMAGVS
jgi:hypothetical protein